MTAEKSLQDLLKERKALDDMIAAKRKAERKQVVEQVKQLCRDYEISQTELRGALKTRERKSREEGAETEQSKSRKSSAN